MVGRFAEVCRRRGLKANAGKSKVMVLNREEGIECEVHVHGIHLEHVLEFEYLECVLDESGTDGAECNRKRGENGDYLTSFMQMTWFYVVSRRKT